MIQIYVILYLVKKIGRELLIYLLVAQELEVGKEQKV